MDATLWLASAISGGLQVLIFPRAALAALSWLALAPLLWALLASDAAGRKRGFLLGYLSGIIWYAGSCYWIYHVMHLYGGLHPAVAAGILLLFCLYLALYHGLFGWLMVACGAFLVGGCRIRESAHHRIPLGLARHSPGRQYPARPFGDLHRRLRIEFCDRRCECVACCGVSLSAPTSGVCRSLCLSGGNVPSWSAGPSARISHYSHCHSGSTESTYSGRGRMDGGLL